jgi:hypothetical protein
MTEACRCKNRHCCACRCKTIVRRPMVDGLSRWNVTNATSCQTCMVTSRGIRFKYGGPFALVRASSKKFLNSASTSILPSTRCGWRSHGKKTVASEAKHRRKRSQSRESKAVRNSSNAARTEDVSASDIIYSFGHGTLAFALDLYFPDQDDFPGHRTLWDASNYNHDSRGRQMQSDSLNFSTVMVQLPPNPGQKPSSASGRTDFLRLTARLRRLL